METQDEPRGLSQNEARFARDEARVRASRARLYLVPCTPYARAAHGTKTVNTGDVIDQASALWQSDAWWPRQRAASTRSKWRWLEAEVARAGGTRSWTAQEDGDAARRGLRRRRQHLGQPLRLQALSSSTAGCGCRKSSLVEPSARAATRTGSVVAE